MSSFTGSTHETQDQVKMAKYSHSEVVGNTAQGRGNTMFNAPAEFERRVVEGNTAQIIQHIYATGASLLETGGSNQSSK